MGLAALFGPLARVQVMRQGSQSTLSTPSSMLVALAPIALAQVAEQPLHCAADGAIVGLAADKAYRVRLPADAPENPETWAVVDEAKTTGPVNSFTGSFVQVQPDDGSSYNEIYGVGSFGRIRASTLPLRQRNRACTRSGCAGPAATRSAAATRCTR